MKKIIIVADDKYVNYANAIINAISKVDGIEAEYWEISYYVDNEMTLPKDTYVILICNNKIASDFKRIIKEKYNKFGILYGYASNKAMIYSDKNMTFIPTEFRQKYNEIIKSNSNKEHILSNADEAVADGVISIGKAVSAGFTIEEAMTPFTKILDDTINLLINHIIDNKKKQYEFGIALFLLNCLDDFLNGK